MKTEKERSETTATTRPARQHPFVTLQYRDYRLLWSSQFVSQIGTQMRFTAIGWQVYILTRDPLQLGMIGLCRVVPMVLCALLGGSVADAVDRRRLLLLTQSILLVASVGLAAVTLTGTVSIWWIYGFTAISSAANAFDRPAYSALIPSLVPRDQLAAAMALGTLNWQTATIVGPGLAGIVIATWGVQGAYWFDALSYGVVLIALLLISYRPSGPTGQRISIAAAIEGLRFVWSKKILVSNMLLDFFATFFGAATLLLPIFAKDILHTDEVGFGLLSAAEAGGAVICSLILAWFNIGRVRRPGWVLLVAVMCYSLFTVLFGLSTSLPLSVLWLALVGASDTVSMALRQTISQLVTPDHMRGRMQSVNMIFFMGGPQLGELEGGIVARVAGAPFAVVTGGLACLGVVAVVALVSRPLREYEFD